MALALLLVQVLFFRAANNLGALPNHSSALIVKTFSERGFRNRFHQKVALIANFFLSKSKRLQRLDKKISIF